MTKQSEGSQALAVGVAGGRNVVAVVTGASSGLGAEFAEQLAARGHALVLVARRKPQLDALAQKLRERHGVLVDVVAVDLQTPEGPAQVVAALDTWQMTPALLINNAGFGAHGPALAVPLPRALGMIDLNVRALTELALTLGARMAARGEGAIVNLASLAAYQANPYFAVYGGTKAYVRNFSFALSRELAPRGVHVLAVCPGPTATEFFEVGQVQMMTPKGTVMSAEACVAASLRALDRRQQVVVPGALNSALAWISRQAPERLMRWASGRVLRPRKRLAPSATP